jgi:hypothetical protein
MSLHDRLQQINAKRKNAESDFYDSSNISSSVDPQDSDSQPPVAYLFGAAVAAGAATGSAATANVQRVSGPAANALSDSSAMACEPLRVRRRHNALGPTEEQLADPEYMQRRHECTECKQKFDNSGNLARHMRRHDRVRPYPCQVCDAAFARSDYLARHMTVHSGARLYVCEECPDKSYSTKGALNKHVATHNGAKPQLCDYCPARFAYAAERIRHTRACHAEAPSASGDAYAYGVFQAGQRFAKLDGAVEAMFSFYCDCGEGFDFPEHLQNHKVKKSH